MTLGLLNGLGGLWSGIASTFATDSGVTIDGHRQALNLQGGLLVLSSSSAAMTADGRVDAVIAGMTALLPGRLELGVTSGAESAMGGIMGSAMSLGQLVAGSAALTTTEREEVSNPDGSTTVTVTTHHAPGLELIQAQLPAQVSGPAQAAALRAQVQLAAGGTLAANTLAGFSADLPEQIPDYVALGAMSPALGAALVPAWPSLS